MWLKLKILIISILLLGASSCSRSKGYFSTNLTQNIELNNHEPLLSASYSKYPPTQSLSVVPFESLWIKSKNEISEVQINQSLSRISNFRTKRDLIVKKKLYQKGVVETIRKFKAQNKIAEKKSGSNHWEPRVKIGLTLLVIGIVLSVFGLGLIGGISAFIGLLFTILGLLNTYY
jgi:hypothetical protein